jgi:uncharacterized protein YndB with AHSA1/START domain
MKTDLLMEFNVDKKNKKITIQREFAAPLSTVWRAWTESKILDKWWAPKPWKAQTKSQDFHVDGRWLYSMNGPEGEEHFATADYKEISLEKSFSVKDAFSDANGKIDTSMPQTTWNVDFKGENGSTIVNIVITIDKAEEFDQFIKTGFQEGMTQGMENLDELIAKKEI